MDVLESMLTTVDPLHPVMCQVGSRFPKILSQLLKLKYEDFWKPHSDLGLFFFFSFPVRCSLSVSADECPELRCDCSFKGHKYYVSFKNQHLGFFSSICTANG